MKGYQKAILLLAPLLVIIYILQVSGLLQSFIQTLTGLNWVFEIDPFSALAFIIAIFSLYFSALRGAHIDLEEVSEFELLDKEYTKASRGDFLNSLELQKSHFLFFNSGNRAGVIKKVTITFQPTASFKQFCRKPVEDCYVYDMTVGTKPITFPQILEDKNSLKVEVNYHFIVLEQSYKSLLSTVSTINEDDSLLSALKKVCMENKQKVDDLISFLSATRELGTFKIEISCLCRRWLYSIKPKIVSIKLMNNYKEFLQSLRSLTTEWETFAPSLGELAHIIIRDLESLIQPIEHNIKNLENPRTSRDTLLPRLTEWSSNLLEKRSYPLLAKWKPRFMQELKILSEAHLDFTERLDETLSLPKEIDITAKIKEMDKLRRELKIKTGKAKQDIITLKDNILKEATEEGFFK